MSPDRRVAALVLLCLPLGSCCAIVRAFCDPREPLPRRSYLTAPQALDTLVAAIACDDARTIWESVGPDMKSRLGVGRFEWELAWKELKARVPGIHQLDLAERSTPTLLPPTSARPFSLTSYRLTLLGNVIEIRLRKYAYWKVDYVTEDMDAPEPVGKYVPDIGDVLKLRSGTHQTRIATDLPGLPWSGAMQSEVLTATVGIEWLVYSFRTIEEQP